MLIRFARHPATVLWNILRFNRRILLTLVAMTSLVALLQRAWPEVWVSLDFRPVGVLGTGLAIFIGFRNNSAYDRWWEARKIWGGFVNASRTFSMQVLTLLRAADTPADATSPLRTLQRDLVYRHLAYLNALRLQLRGQSDWQELAPFLSSDEQAALAPAVNKATQLNLRQARELARARQEGWLDAYGHVELTRSLGEFYDLQGKAERIKSTVFPYYYNFYTRVFVWIFALLFSLAVVESLGLLTIPIATVVNFMFALLEQNGRITENPFENLAGDTPLSALCRIIEIDLRQHLGEQELPPKLLPQWSRFGSEYLM